MALMVACLNRLVKNLDPFVLFLPLLFAVSGCDCVEFQLLAGLGGGAGWGRGVGEACYRRYERLVRTRTQMPVHTGLCMANVGCRCWHKCPESDHIHPSKHEFARRD